MKYLKTILIYFIMFLFIHSLISCGDNSVGPTTKIITSGLKGTITDISGNILSNVSIYNLFYSPNFPPKISTNSSTFKLFKIADFDYNLEQNLPNPLYNSTFLRFSLPTSASVKITISDKVINKNVYEYSSNFPKGFFQIFINNIVDSLRLKNGLYKYTMTAKVSNQVQYTDTKELLIISDKGTPNSISDNKGFFKFDYDYIFNGDSVVTRSLNGFASIRHLTNTVFLLFKKEGYQPKYILVTLSTNLFLNRDVVLTKEN